MPTPTRRNRQHQPQKVDRGPPITRELAMVKGQIGGVYTTLCQEEGILLQKYRDRNGRLIAMLFRSSGVSCRFDQ